MRTMIGHMSVFHRYTLKNGGVAVLRRIFSDMVSREEKQRNHDCASRSVLAGESDIK